MNGAEEFYTMKGYTLHADGKMTNAMEDYLEMIARLAQYNESVRVNELSKMLHVKASSVTKMVQQLGRRGLIRAEKYGDISLTEKGKKAGDYLLHRHEVIQRFLCMLNNSESELEQTEKIEHFLDENTVKNLEQLTERLQKREVYYDS